MGQIGPIQIRHGQFAEHIVQDRGRVLDAVIALHHAGGFELGEGERVNEFLERDTVLQAHGHGDGKIVHHRAEARAFLVHVDKDLAQGAVFVFTGAQIDFVPAHIGLLGIALAPLRHLFAVRFDDLFDDDLLDDLFGQHGGFLVGGAAFQRFGGLVIILDQRRSQRLRQF